MNTNKNATAQETAANTPEIMILKEIWVVDGKRLGRGKPSAEIIQKRVRHRVKYPKTQRYDPAVHGIGEPVGKQ